jgi:hypothetical protein
LSRTTVRSSDGAIRRQHDSHQILNSGFEISAFAAFIELLSVSVAPAATAAIPATAAEVSLHHGFRFVHGESAAVKLRPIQLRDRLVRVFFGHCYKTKTFRAACIAIGNDAHSFHSAAVRKGVSYIVLSGLERKVSNKQFFGHFIT